MFDRPNLSNDEDQKHPPPAPPTPTDEPEPPPVKDPPPEPKPKGPYTVLSAITEMVFVSNRHPEHATFGLPRRVT